MSDPASTAQRQQQRRQGLIATAISLPLRLFGVLIASLMLGWAPASQAAPTLIWLLARLPSTSLTDSPLIASAPGISTPTIETHGGTAQSPMVSGALIV